MVLFLNLPDLQLRDSPFPRRPGGTTGFAGSVCLEVLPSPTRSGPSPLNDTAGQPGVRVMMFGL